MSKDDESLGKQHTVNAGTNDTDPQSLGDELTMGNARFDGLVEFDDDMESVDLSARYAVERVLGQGGMGEVLLATDQRLERQVAVKRILGDGVRNRTAVSRFLTEAKSIAALSHPNIVQIYDYGRDSDGPFLIMEYVDGGSLLDRCRDGVLPLEEAVNLTCQLCSALETAHDAGIIHRDIKPANVLLTKDGVPALTDFGLAKSEVSDLERTMAGAVLGTFDFMPPEQRRDVALMDARSDLWSLAATLYQLVTNEPPRVIDLDDVPRQLRQTLSTALKSKMSDRYQTAREFREALQDCLKSNGPILEAVTFPEAGECPQCHTMNDSSRKFCRECAERLRLPCLKCEIEIPIWDKVCGECGGKQAELAEPQRSEMSSRQYQAQTLLSHHDYQAAEEIAVGLRDEPNMRFQHLNPWSEQFLQQIANERTQQLTRTSELLQEAQQHEVAFDYESGIQALEQVPTILRDEVAVDQPCDVSTVLLRLKGKLDESHCLDKQIQQRVDQQDLNGLLDDVDALLVLRPHRKDTASLRERLIERDRILKETRDAAYREGQRLYQSQDYEGCLSEIGRIDPSMMMRSAEKLREDAAGRRDHLKVLRQAILGDAKGTSPSEQLKQIEEYLTLQRDDEEVLSLRERLIERDRTLKETRDAAYREGQRLYQSQDYEGCLSEIGRIDPSMMMRSAEKLREDAAGRRDHLRVLRQAILRQTVLGNLKGTSPSERLKQIDEYLTLRRDDGEILSLREPLVERDRTLKETRAAAYLEGQRLYQLQDYEGCLSEIGRIDSSMMMREIEKLREDAAGRRDHLKALRQAILGNAKGTSPSEQLKQIEEYLTLQRDDEEWASTDEEVLSLRERLKAQMEENTAHVTEVVEDAVKLHGQGRLEAACLKLRNLDAEMQTQEVVDLLREYDSLVDRQTQQERHLAAKTVARRALIRTLVVAVVAIMLVAIAIDIVPEKSAERIHSPDVNTEIGSHSFVPPIIDDDDEETLGVSSRSTSETSVKQADESMSGTPQSLRRLDVGEADDASFDFSKLPADIVSNLSPYAISRLPADALARISIEVFAALAPERNSIGMDLKLIPPGTFTMGSDSRLSYSYEKPQHQVELTKLFYLGTTEVTQRQYERVMGANPSHFQNMKNPVENVDWYDAVEFCRRLSNLPEEKSVGHVYRLPSEAEWEYVCRAGTKTAYGIGDNTERLGEYAWFKTNSAEVTHAVGQKQANAWGLYDMHGNVWEWCQDWRGDYSSGSIRDPKGPKVGTLRVYRGGSWHDESKFLRSAYRGQIEAWQKDTNIGFRVARTQIIQN